ncbi:LuxR C-terminal-related transcriptional regulator [Nocardia thailandica]
MNDIALDTMPHARDILRAVDTADAQPLILLIQGRSGTGKSTLLNVVRQRMRGRSGPDQPLIADDVHALPADRIESLCRTIESGDRSVVLAAQPRPHDSGLRSLAEVMSRCGRTVDLRTLSSSDIGPFARELGMMVPPQIAQYIHQGTAGIHGGVVAALSATRTSRLESCGPVVDDALGAWSRSLLVSADADLLDTLVVAATGTGLDAGELTEVLGVDLDTAHRLIDRARACALVTDADLLLRAAVGPLRTLLGDRRFVAVQRRLLSTRLEAGLLRDHTGLALAESGVRDDRLADFLCRAAENNHAEAARYYAAAVSSGADPAPIAVRWADAAARAGDDDTALRLAEPVLERGDVGETELATAVRVCAGVLTRRGLVARAAALYTWLGARRVGADWAVATTVLALAGDGAGADEMAAGAENWPPTPGQAGARLVAGALLESLDPHGAGTTGAIARLVQAAHADHANAAGLPCNAVTVAALLSLSAGEPRRAGDAVRAAAGAGSELPVLSAWTAFRTGDEPLAADILAGLDLDALAPRDRLLAHGLAVGLARRGGDAHQLGQAWNAAHPLFDKVDADLLSVLPVGELWLAGIQLRDEARIQPLVTATLALLRRLGRAPAWANVFHWYGVQAAIIKQSPQDLLPHAHALKNAAADGDPHAAALADAGRTWVLVLRREADAGQVHAAVTALAAAGLTWDAARLAGDAALTTADATTATALLRLARSVRGHVRTEPAPAAAAPADPPATGANTAPPAVEPRMLSEREREVAELMLLGLTYREIGARLYISAKTVEHHVARIRRRIGARSRSELLSMLRAMGHGSLAV